MKKIKTREDAMNKFVVEKLGKKVSEMTDKEVCQHYREVDISINKTECFNSGDIAIHALLEAEMAKRDIDVEEGELIFVGRDGEDIS
jgi:hypothetical protein